MSSASQLDIFGGEDVASVIFDLGSHTTRVGYGQEDCPRQWWSSLCGKSLNYTDDTYSQKLEFPLDLYAPRDSTEIKPCLYSNGTDYSIDPHVFELIVSYSVEGYNPYIDYEGYDPNVGHINKLTSGLGVKINEHPFLLSEPSKHSNIVREMMCEIMFDRFQVPALFLAKQAALSAFSVGRVSALVTDIGALGMNISPVTDGYVLQRNITQFSVGGNLLDWHIHNSITTENQVNIMPFYGKKHTQQLSTSNNYSSYHTYDLSRVHSSFLQYSQMETIRSFKESVCKVIPQAQSNDSQSDKQNLKNSSIQGYNLNDLEEDKPSFSFFELPDGTNIDTKNFKYNIGELLFKPELIRNKLMDPLVKNFEGLPQAILKTILRCDVDLRKDLLNNIILTGGTSLMPGLVDRVNQELYHSNSLRNSSMKFKIVVPNTSIEHRFDVWLGGSILASLGTFQQLWVSKQEYDEHGPNIINRRCN